MDDYRYLLIAYGLGGAAVVKNPAVRSSLITSGLMEPTGGFRVWGSTSHIMRLTKAGRRRAEEIQRQIFDAYPAGVRRKIQRTEKINMAATKRKPRRYSGTSNGTIKR